MHNYSNYYTAEEIQKRKHENPISHTISPGKLPNPAKQRTTHSRIKVTNANFHFILSTFVFYFETYIQKEDDMKKVRNFLLKDTFSFGVPPYGVVWACSKLK